MTVFKVLKIDNEPGDQLIELLENNLIGSPGESMLYRHKNVRSKVKAIQHAYFANLSIRGKLYGTICLIHRNVYSSGRSHQAYYLRYFTIHEKLRANNPKKFAGRSVGMIREDVAGLMNGQGLDGSDDLVLYAYVDPENIRSKRLIDEFGFEKKGTFKTIPFTRFFPKPGKNVQRIKSSERKIIVELLRAFYKKEQLVSFEHLIAGGNYFAIYKDGEIVCGAQGIKDGWEIKSLPGFTGKIAMRVLPRLPFLKRLFNPDYNFVFLEYIYCRKGHEKDLELLFEHILSHYRLFSGVICLDPRSDIYDRIRHLSLGVVRKIMGEKSIDIVAKEPRSKQIEGNLPFYVSGYDVL
ncbi:MAG: hypothetical protein MI975_12030 [Cytophagales bacterium]|nr:hypothetical protein [Cytophagales bacterium]